MKTHNLPLVIAAAVCVAQLATADTITLKNGDVLEGRVLRENEENYVLEVKFSSTIREEKVVLRTDVKSIEKETEDAKEFAKIAGHVPTPELLDIAEYEERVQQIEEFIKAYPSSSLVKKAKEMLEVLGQELIVVREGGIKFGEEMVAGKDYEANAYEFDARIAEAQIREAVSRRDFLKALRQFDTYELYFADADGRDGLAAVITQVLNVYGSNLNESIASLESRLSKRVSGLHQMSPDDRAKTQRALNDEQARINAKYEQEKAANTKWITPDAYHKESLDAAKRTVESELSRLGNKATSPEATSSMAEIYRVTWGKLGSGDVEEKKKALEDARTARMPEFYMEKLTTRADLPKP